MPPGSAARVTLTKAGSRPSSPSLNTMTSVTIPPPAPVPVVSQFSSSPPLRSLSPEELLEQTQVLDDLMDNIGMGKFQKQLLVLCGLGWFADNMWLQCIALILPRVQAQFEIRDQYIGILSSSMFVGMMFGAMFWGTLSDVYGRKQAFNFTLIVTTVFGIGASFANSYWLLCLLILGLGFGVGGNMPVDGALFLEFTPKKNQYLLTFLSIFFSFGAVATSILGYFLLPRYSCETPVEGGCQGKGWRYMLLAMGSLTLSMVVGRVILFRLEESPKYLLNQNRHQEAAVVLCRIYKINHKETQSEAFDENIETLTLRFNRPVNAGDISSSDESSSSASDASEAELSDIENSRNGSSGRRRTESNNHGRSRRQNGSGGSGIQHHRPPGGVGNGNGGDHHSKTWIMLQRYRRRWRYRIEKGLERLEPLFVPEFRLSTILIWIIWALVAFAYTAFNVFYPKFLQEHGQGGHQPLQLVYMDILIYAAAGVPGSVIATVMVEGRLGRRYTMAVSTFGTALATILFAVLSSRAAMTTFSAILSLLATLNYAVLYSYTPEVFPSDIRGTACGVAAAMSRLAGIITPLIVGVMLSVNTYFPLYTASIMFFVSAVCMCFLPIETKGRAAT
ncbi:major facilitator superfamily domain-containing protein [Linnemannia elongata]|nr:major facilitator superfamily domain-containing protein [Linnemannia elongata]